MRAAISRRIGTVLCVASVLLSLPALAHASVESDLAAQIAQLLGQINALQGQGGGQPATQPDEYGIPGLSAAPAPLVCPVFTRTLKRGSRGPDVEGLQSFLVSMEFLSEEAVTGFFGPLTEQALQRWQAAEGVVSEGTPETTGWGVAGRRTATAVLRVCSQPVVTTVRDGYDPANPMSCPIARPPTDPCATGWQPKVDAYGCTRSYSCTTTTVTISTSSISSTSGAQGRSCADIGWVRPTSFCSGSWQASLNAAGCQIGWQCVPPGGSVAPTNLDPVANPPSISVALSPVNVAQGTFPGPSAGGTLTLWWSTNNAPGGAAVALWLVGENGENHGLIKRSLDPSGTVGWAIPGPQCQPAIHTACSIIADSPFAQYTKIGMYRVVASLYTPPEAYLGGFSPTNPVQPTFLAIATSSAFSVIQ